MSAICVGCKIDMVKDKSGQFAIDDDSVYWGDKYHCPECGTGVFVLLGSSFANEMAPGSFDRISNDPTTITLSRGI